MNEYKLRPETIIDIIETVPDDRVDLLMKELAEMVHQAKLSFDFCKALAPSARARLNNPVVWHDDGKGEISVTHSIGETVVLKTEKRIHNEHPR